MLRHYALRKVRCKLYALRRLRPLLGCFLLSQLYQAFILPVFDYCVVAWMPTTAVLSKCLECIHSEGPPECSSFVKLTLIERHCFYTAVQVFKLLHPLFP